MDILIYLKAVLIGIVEGITEFLPISSTGHMILVDQYVKLSENKTFTDAFEVIIQLGAILSVVVYFWKDIWPFAGNKERQKQTWQLWAKVLTGVIPAAVIGYFLDDYIKANLFNPVVVAVTLAFYGIVLIVMERYNSTKKSFRYDSVPEIPYAIAIAIGLFQCLAMVPGTSRSAATIIGAMLLGFSRGAAAEYSFFLAIPTMFGASLITIAKSGTSFNPQQWGVIATGFIVSFIVAFIVIRFFMNFIKKHDFSVFGYYRIVLGIVVLILLWGSR